MARALSAYAESDFVTAARLSFELLSEQPSYLPALVCFARAVQLADEEATPQFALEDARAALHKAAALHSIATDAEHELARFLYAVEDKDEEGLEVVERAIAARAAQLRDLLMAKVEILQDLGRRPEAKSVARTALKMFPNDTGFRAAVRE